MSAYFLRREIKDLVGSVIQTGKVQGLFKVGLNPCIPTCDV
jgi:hypothetical protein